MPSRESPSSDRKARRLISVAAAILFLAVAAVFLHVQAGYLTLRDPDSGQVYARYRMRVGDTFSIGFIHSVNNSPVTDFYEIREDGIYVVKTVYYGFGAGVQTELEEGQTLSYGDDGSMIISGFDRRMDPLTYIVGTVSDHVLTLQGKREVSLRDTCGRNAKVSFSFERN